MFINQSITYSKTACASFYVTLPAKIRQHSPYRHLPLSYVRLSISLPIQRTTLIYSAIKFRTRYYAVKASPYMAGENSQRYARSAAERDLSNINLDPFPASYFARYAFN